MHRIEGLKMDRLVVLQGLFVFQST
jgi:hypothetical protein